MNNIEIIKTEVTKLLNFDNSGHGIDHINRVFNISVNISKKEKSNIELVKVIALLHDADDYKLFGDKCADSLANTKNILEKTSFNDLEKNIIINSIKTIGFSKRLEGIIPQIIEAKIVSDADMLDGMGTTGILRTYQYNISHNNVFFDKNIFPNLNMNYKEYKLQKKGTSRNHIFEKILKLKDYMLTKAGKEETLKRHEFVIQFLKEYFYEENATEWIRLFKQLY